MGPETWFLQRAIVGERRKSSKRILKEIAANHQTVQALGANWFGNPTVDVTRSSTTPSIARNPMLIQSAIKLLSNLLIDPVTKFLSKHGQVSEYHVQVREIWVTLDVGHDEFFPQIGIKIFKGNANKNRPFHFSVSHYAKTPDKFITHYMTLTDSETEEEAIDRAISETIRPLALAIEAGHEPQEHWMIPNKFY